MTAAGTASATEAARWGWAAATGVAMTLMLVGSPGLVGGPLWLAGFAVATLWFAARAVYRYVEAGGGAAGQDLQQLVLCAAMLYMIAHTVPFPAFTMAGGTMSGMGMPGMAGMPGMPGMAMSATAPRLGPGLAGALLLAVAAVAVWTARLVWTAWTAVEHRPGRRPSTGCAAACCQFVMAATTAYMLVPLL